MEWHILVYLSYKKSSNNRKNLQHYSQDVNYYETVKKVHKKVIKIFYHLTTCTLPVYGNQMNRASLRKSNVTCDLCCLNFDKNVVKVLKRVVRLGRGLSNKVMQFCSFTFLQENTKSKLKLFSCWFRFFTDWPMHGWTVKSHPI